jgi:hypothetical protein
VNEPLALDSDRALNFRAYSKDAELSAEFFPHPLPCLQFVLQLIALNRDCPPLLFLALHVPMAMVRVSLMKTLKTDGGASICRNRRSA